MQNIVHFMIIVFFLSFACATVVVKDIIGPDGKIDKLIKCYAIEECYSKAAEICQGRYQILNTTSQFHGNYSSFQMIDSTTDLFIKCEEPFNNLIQEKKK